MLDMVRCPKCRDRVHIDRGYLRCNLCQINYPIVKRIPILLCDEVRRKALEHEEISRPRIGWLNRLVTPRYKHKSSSTLRQMFDLLHNSGVQNPIVLVVGGGELGIGLEDVVQLPNVTWIETDIYLGTRNGLVADGHQLPFQGESFDAVVCQSVLEHVLNPWTVASELQRVVKNNGYIFSQAAFMQQVHEGDADYFRFSHRAHRLLFAEQQVIAWGLSLGAANSLAWSLRYFLRALLGRIPCGRLFSYAIYCLTLVPAKWIDTILGNSKLASEAASETYFLFRKRTEGTPLDDSLPREGAM